MTKPPTSVRSLRYTVDLWSRLTAEAERRGVSLNALMVEFAEAGLSRAAPVTIKPQQKPQPSPLPQPERSEDRTPSVKVSVPVKAGRMVVAPKR
jgi:hypothetical protein